MNYQRYFKSGQKILLTALNNTEDARTELLTGEIFSSENDEFVITLPYSDDAADQYPFTPAMPFKISSEVMGLGVRLTAEFVKKIDGKKIALSVHSDLQMFQRRNSPRTDCKIGIRFTRGQGALKALRSTWEKNIKILKSPDAPLIFEGFKPCHVNLSSGGIRFNLRPPAQPAELCLILLNLDDGMTPICTLAEIVWTRPENDETVIVSGMRFISILEADQQRISKFIKQQG